MKVLITAGSTSCMIDKVRAISNIFSGETGAAIAVRLNLIGIDCTLVTSNRYSAKYYSSFMQVVKYRTFDELKNAMENEICSGSYDAIIHSAAVSDYAVSRVMVMESGQLQQIDTSAKISSSHSKLYLELEPTIKIVDLIRKPWGFNGKLFKFKLQIGVSDDELIKIATASMLVSGADFIVANCLEWIHERAYIIGADGTIVNVPRELLPVEIYRRLP